MGNRLTKITTRTGDGGTTGLGDGSRVAKTSLRIVAIGVLMATSILLRPRGILGERTIVSRHLDAAAPRRTEPR